MGTVLPFKKPQVDDDAVREQAALWIARLDAGASEADLQEIQAWLAAHPAHAPALLDFARLWDRMDMLQPLSSLFPLDPAGKPQRAQGWSSAGLAALAATLLLAVGALAWLHPFAADEDPARNFTASHRTAVGEQRSVALADGSRIVLNTASTIEITYRDEVRHITLLDGEGLFEVARDPERPFRVQAGERVVEAVGTAFSVHRGAADELEVLVSEGKVLLHAGGDAAAGLSVPLVAGQYAALGAEQSVPVAIDMPLDQLDARLSWQHGMLLFRDQALADVLAQISRYTTLHIQAAPEVLAIRVDGYYRVDDIEGTLASFDTNFDIDIQREGNEIRLVPQ